MKKGIILLFCIITALLSMINNINVFADSVKLEGAAKVNAEYEAKAKAETAASNAEMGSMGSDDSGYTHTAGDPSGGAKAAGGGAKDGSTNNITGLTTSELRDGNVDMYSIPLVIVSVTEMLIKIAGTIAILALVYHSIQMQINSGITGDSTGTDKAKKGMIGSLIGFVVAVSAWFLVTKALDLLSAL